MARGKSKAFPHGRSIKNPVTYEALKRSGKSKKADSAQMDISECLIPTDTVEKLSGEDR